MRSARAAIVALVATALACACSLTIDTKDLSGGERPDASGDGAVDTRPIDTGDAEPCDPSSCIADVVVVKLADITPCSKTAPTSDRLACRKKIHDLCVARDSCCFQGGYGPVEFPNALEATVVCVHGEPYTAPATEITTSGCTAAGFGSRTCDEATHTAAKKRGYSTGIIMSVGTDSTVTILGLASADATPNVDTPWSELTALVPGCTATTVDSQDCTTAAHRYCTSDAIGTTAGWGPVSWNATASTLMCIY